LQTEAGVGLGIYTKLFSPGGILSFVGGLAVAWILTEGWRRAITPE